jgi:hypothetical protein
MAIRDKILSAFAGLAYPGDNLLPRDDSDDAEYSVESLRGKRWEILTHEDLSPSHDETIWALSVTAFQYYLPGLLLLCIDDPEGSTTLPHAIVDQLTAREHDDQYSLDRKAAKIAILSEQQRQALVVFFDYLGSLDEHCPALLDDARLNVTDGTVRVTPEEAIDRWFKGLEL